MTHRLWLEVRKVLALLAARDYEGIKALDRASRLGVEDIWTTVESYPCTLVEPPDTPPPEMQVIEVSGPGRRRWRVDTPVWTREEGASDLYAIMTLTDCGGAISVRLDDVLVP